MRRLFIVIAILFAQTALAGDYEDGMAALERKDYATALAKFRSAAERDNPHAQINLGNMFVHGMGMPPDEKEAVRWYRLAAKHGIAAAQYNLGLMYEHGRGLQQDYREAARFYRLAADGGLEVAQHAIASLYFRGDGVAKSNLLAYMWSSIASSRGNKDSKNLNYMAAGRMTLKEQEKVEHMARECMASSFKKCDSRK